MLDDEKERFVRLLASHERRLYAYVLSMVPNWVDADEIFQETNVRLWRDFEEFEPGTNFAAWAMRVAYYQILTWRKRTARNQLVFDDAILQTIAEQHERSEPLTEARHRALGECLQQLTTRSRDLLARCYAPGARINDVATSLGRTRPAVYKALQRIRSALRECIEHRTAPEKLT